MTDTFEFTDLLSLFQLNLQVIVFICSQVFTVGKEGGLWHMWELERGGVWNSWEQVMASGSAIASHVNIMNDEKGWWAAFAVSLSAVMISFFLLLGQELVKCGTKHVANI